MAQRFSSAVLATPMRHMFSQRGAQSLRSLAAASPSFATAARLSVTPCRRGLHSARPAVLLNTINPDSDVLRSGQNQTEKLLSKRLADQAHEEAARNLPAAFESAEAFLAQVESSVFRRLEQGLADMLDANPAMRVLMNTPSAGNMEVELGEGKGSFVFTSDPAAQRLLMFTPQSAETHRYRYDPREQRFVADSDGHALEELFVRDIIQTGLLSFPQL
jgi:hypothetical protein